MPSLTTAQRQVLAVIAAGGVLGSEARYGVGVLMPHSPAGFPWSTLTVNASGCFLIGVLMVLIAEVAAPHRLLRPFVGIGVLGGYTTFSTYTVDIQRLLVEGRPYVAFAYLAGTLAGALAAVWTGVAVTRVLNRNVTHRAKARTAGRTEEGEPA